MKLRVHILEGSTFPERFAVATDYGRWEHSLRELENDLFTASGVLRIRIDAIIDGVTALKTMLENPRRYPLRTLSKAHARFLGEFDEHLEVMRVALNGPREKATEAREWGARAYEGAEKVVGHVNKKKGQWKWFPAISGEGKEAINRELELARHTQAYTSEIIDDISLVYSAIMSMLSDISAKKAEGARQFHVIKNGLKVEDAIKVLERYVERAERDRRGIPAPVMQGEGE
ncbi:hypothetical protein BT69DRAFT_1295358 [Atractiella rhizophila]|nr:hypothetical protein BT69DRAFT_1295358 [Atractiella rhizophila]